MRNPQNTYKTQGGDNMIIIAKENAPLLEYLIKSVNESRSKLKATLQGRGIAVNGRMVTQFDYQLKTGDKITISRHKKQNQFKSRYVKIVYEDRWLVVVEKNIGILSMAAGHSSLNVKSVLDDYFLKSRQKCRAHVVHRLDRDTSGLMVYAKEMKAKQAKVEIKEIRFGPQTDEHDYNFKLKHAQEFLSEGNKVRAYVFFRGRSILFKEQGEVLLLRFANDLEEYAKVEQLPKLDGKKMFLYLAPKKAGVVKKSQQKMDREKREAEARSVKEAENNVEEVSTNGGLLANAKVSAEALKVLKGEE